MAAQVIYRLHFFFDTGSGVCLWAGNDAARERYDYPIDPRQLPLPEATATELEHIAAWYDQWMDWDRAPEANPAWDAAEDARFKAAARQLLDKVRQQLGPEYEVIDEALFPQP